MKNVLRKARVHRNDMKFTKSFHLLEFTKRDIIAAFIAIECDSSEGKIKYILTTRKNNVRKLYTRHCERVRIPSHYRFQ